MSYNFNIQNSWCDMYDDLSETCLEKSKKEILDGTNSINSFSTGIKSHDFKTKKNTSEPTENEQLSLGEILSLDFLKENISELELLKHQIYVTSQLKKYILSCIDNSNNFDKDFHLPKLEWLAKSSLFLSKKHLQKDIRFKKKQDHVQRNSYEFCEMGSKCVNREGKCKKKHIVYNYVHCDICELITHLTNKTIITTKDIFTSINTINYVFNHMYDELCSV